MPKEQMNYNSVGFLGFVVEHKLKDPYLCSTVTADALRKSIIKKLAEYDDEDLLQAVELQDTVSLGGLDET